MGSQMHCPFSLCGWKQSRCLDRSGPFVMVWMWNVPTGSCFWMFPPSGAALRHWEMGKLAGGNWLLGSSLSLSSKQLPASWSARMLSIEPQMPTATGTSPSQHHAFPAMTCALYLWSRIISFSVKLDTRQRKVTRVPRNKESQASRLWKLSRTCLSPLWGWLYQGPCHDSVWGAGCELLRTLKILHVWVWW